MDPDRSFFLSYMDHLMESFVGDFEYVGGPFQIIRAIDDFSSWEIIWSENGQTTLETTAFEEENG